MRQLAERTAVVTGAGSGIGRALALTLAAEGMNVVVSDIRQTAADVVADEVRATGVRALGIACDVSQRDAVRTLAAATTEEFGQIHLLVANAGVTSFKDVADLTDDEWDWIYGVDVFGVTNCLQAFLPGMIAQGEGHVVTTASMAGLIPSWQPRHAPYSSAKALVIALTVNMRPELAEHGIGCTVICPGGVATNILNTPSYRPERFGGAAATEVTPAGRDSGQFRYRVRTAEQVARMTLRAVRRDELFVLTDGSMRSLYEDYAKEVLAAFDAATEFESDPGFS